MRGRCVGVGGATADGSTGAMLATNQWCLAFILCLEVDNGGKAFVLDADDDDGMSLVL